MVSSVLYRPFEESDFDTLAGIMQRQWHTRGDGDLYNFLEACDDLAYCLSVSTFSQVALVDGEPRGLVLARSGSPDPAWRERWEQASADFLAQMHEVDTESEQAYRSFIELADSVNRQLVETAQLDCDSEITLLVVDDAARHQGIGSVLIDASISYLSAQGQTRSYLCTDTDCAWEFYERRGMKRLAKHHASWEERKLLPREMYVYGIDLSR